MTSSRLRMSLRIQTGGTMTPSLVRTHAHFLSHHTVPRLVPVSQTLRMTNRYRAQVSDLHRGCTRPFRFRPRNPQPSDRVLAPVHHPYSSPHPLLHHRLHPFLPPRPHLPCRLLVPPTSLGDKERERMIASYPSNVPEDLYSRSGCPPRPPPRWRLMSRFTVEPCSGISCLTD